MGGTRWDDSTRASYTSYSSSISHTKSAHEVFTKRSLASALDPSNITIRESCDSDVNPTSNAVIVALDVTGSMGSIAHQIAKEGLGTLAAGLIDRQSVVDPHLMFMGVGDAAYDSSPLQVTQFEGGIQILDQLKELYVESGGGGNDSESYDLPWIFAAHKTNIDCFNKRGKKGYLFTIGDELPPQSVSKYGMQKTFGQLNEQLNHDYPADESLRAAQEKYHVFHIIVEQGNYCRRNLNGAVNAWTQLLGRRAIRLKRSEYVAEVIISAIELSEGRDYEEVVNSWQDETVRDTIRHAFAGQ